MKLASTGYEPTPPAGDDRALFRELVRQLAVSAGTRYALLGRVDPTGTMVETIAAWADGAFEELSYELHGTPCAGVLDEGMCVYPRGVARLFPEDALLTELGIESYAGIPVVDVSPRVLVAVFDTEPLDGPRVLPAVRQFAARVRSELARLHAEERESEARATVSRSEAILAAVAGVAELLLVVDDWEDVADDVLRGLGAAAEVSRAFLFESARDADRVVSRMTHEWVAPGVSPSIGNPYWQRVVEHPEEVARLRRGEVLRYTTSEMDSPHRTVMETENIVSSVSVPIHVDGELWGYLGLDDTERERAWEAESGALRAAGGTIGAAIARARIRESLLTRDRILQAVAAGAELLVAAPSWRDAAGDLLALIGEASGAGRAGLYACRVERDRVVSSLQAEWAADGVGPTSVDAWTDVLEPAEQSAGLRAGQAVVFGADDGDPWMREQMRLEGTSSFLAVPFHVAGELAGFIGLDDTVGGREWLAGEEEALRAAASLIGTAVEREQARAREHASERVLAAVADVSRLLLDTQSWRAAIPEIVALLGEAAGASRGSFHETRWDGDMLLATVVEQWCAPGVPVADVDVWVEQPVRPRSAEILASGKALQLHLQDFNPTLLPAAERDGTLSTLAVPVLVAGELVAALSFDDVTGQRVWSSSEEEALHAAAGALAAAIARRRSTETLRSRERILTAVSAISQRLLTAPSYDDVLDDMLAEIGEATGADRVFLDCVTTAENGSMSVAYARDWVREGVRSLADEPAWQIVPLGDEYLERLRRGEAVQALTTEVEGPLRELLEAAGTRSGTVVPVLVRGRVWGLLGFNDCHAERIWAEAEIEALSTAARSLSAAVERAYADDEARASEERLWEAQKMEAVGRLAGGVAHDLNNYLTAIVGYGAFLRDSLPEGEREDADALLAVSERVRQLVRQLLQLSRPVERDAVDPIDVADTVRGVEAVMKALAGDDVAVVLDVPTTTPPVAIAPDDVERVVVNLGLNARDAMPDGGVLTIEVRAADDEVQISVQDTGVGMDDETLRRSLDPFFTTKGSAGVGLGLSTVYGIVNRRGGHVDVETASGVGTRVTVSLPRAA